MHLLQTKFEVKLSREDSQNMQDFEGMKLLYDVHILVVPWGSKLLTHRSLCLKVSSESSLEG